MISCEDREKVVLWFGCGPPCLLCLWLPLNQSANLTADTIPVPQPFVSPRMAIIIPAFISFILYFFDPSGGTVSVYLSDYGFLYNKRLVFRKAGHLYAEPHTHIHTHTQFCSETGLSIHLALETTGDSRPHVLVPVQTHTLVPSGLF